MVIEMNFTTSQLRDIISSLYREENFGEVNLNIELPAHSYDSLVEEFKSILINNNTILGGVLENPDDFKFSMIKIPGCCIANIKKGTKLLIELKQDQW